MDAKTTVLFPDKRAWETKTGILTIFPNLPSLPCRPSNVKHIIAVFTFLLESRKSTILISPFRCRNKHFGKIPNAMLNNDLRSLFSYNLLLCYCGCWRRANSPFTTKLTTVLRGRERTRSLRGEIARPIRGAAGISPGSAHEITQRNRAIYRETASDGLNVVSSYRIVRQKADLSTTACR